MTADASSTNYIYLDSVKGLSVGQTLYFSTNAATPTQVTISNIEGLKVTLTTTVTGTQANFARLFQAGDVVSSLVYDITALGAVADSTVMSWINGTGLFVATKEAGYTGYMSDFISGAVDISSYLAQIASAVKGTYVIATYTTLGANITASGLPQLFEEFTNLTGGRIRLLLLLSSDATAHSALNTVLKTLRGLQYSCLAISGCALGDIALTSGTDPITRAKALNSGDFILAGMGYEGLPACMSLAPYVAGILSANSVKRNLTGDVISVGSVEKTFGNYNAESEHAPFVNAGVLTITTKRSGYVVTEGLTTYTNHNNIWNEADDTSYLIQQRQLADYVYEGYKQEMEDGVGADEFTADTATKKGLRILKKFFDGGFITEYRISNAYEEGNATITEPEVVLAQGKDFVGFILRIKVPN